MKQYFCEKKDKTKLTKLNQEKEDSNTIKKERGDTTTGATKYLGS